MHWKIACLGTGPLRAYCLLCCPKALYSTDTCLFFGASLTHRSCIRRHTGILGRGGKTVKGHEGLARGHNFTSVFGLYLLSFQFNGGDTSFVVRHWWFCWLSAMYMLDPCFLTGVYSYVYCSCRCASAAPPCTSGRGGNSQEINGEVGGKLRVVPFYIRGLALV